MIHEILDLFCHYSGHKVNSSKSKIFYCFNTDASVQEEVENMLGFSQIDDL